MHKLQAVAAGGPELAEIDFAEQAGLVEMFDHAPQPFRRFRMLAGPMFEEHGIGEKQQAGRQVATFHVIYFASLERRRQATRLSENGNGGQGIGNKSATPSDPTAAKKLKWTQLDSF
jgi:hypothetical protein